MAFSNKEVETRVVEMEFDNKQFEKGAEQTMGTLEKLKKSLNFDNTNSGLDNLQKSINKVSFKGLTDQVSSIESAFTTLAGRIKVNFFDQIANYIINAGVQLERSTIGQIISGGKSRAMNIATAKFKMEGMGVTWEQIFKDLDYAVAGTAYGLDAAANIGSQLVASGVQVGDDMATALRAVSGVAAMTSSSYEEIGNVFAAVAGQGKVMAMQLNQLSLRGINAYATLGKYLNMTEAEVRDTVSKGQIDFQTFANAMDEAFGEHAKEANKTFTGAMSNVKAALSKVGQMFYSPFYDAMIAPLNEIRETINDVKNALTDTKDGTVVSFEQNLAEVVKLGGELLLTLLKVIRVGVKELIPAIDKLNIKMEGIIHTMKDVKNWINKIIPDDAKEKMEEVEEGIKGITEAEVEAAKNIWGENDYGYGEERIANLKKLGLNAEKVQKLVDEMENTGLDATQALKNLGFQIENVGEAAEDQNQTLGEMTTGAKILTDVISIFTMTFKKAVTIVTAAKDAFHNIFPATEEGGILYHFVRQLKNLVAHFNLTEKDAENVKKAFEGVFSVVRLVGDIIKAVLVQFDKLNIRLNHGDSILLSFAGSIGEFLKEWVKNIEEGKSIEKFIGGITDKIVELWDAFEKFWGFKPTEIFEHLYDVSKKVTDYMSKHTLGDSIKYITTQVKEFFSLIFGKKEKKGPSAFDTLKAKFISMKPFFSEALDVLKSFWESFQQFVKNITYIFNGQWDTLAAQGHGGLAEHLQNFSNNVDRLITSFTDTMTSLLEKVAGADAGEVAVATENVSSMSNSVGDMLVKVRGDISLDRESISATLVDIKAIISIFSTFLASISFYKIADGIQGFGVGFEALADSFVSCTKAIKKGINRVTKAIALREMSKAVLYIAGALLLVIVSIGALTWIANKDGKSFVVKASLIVGGLLLILGAFVILLSHFASFKGAITVYAAAAVMIGFAASLGVLIYAIKEVSDNKELSDRLGIIAMWLGGLAAGLTIITAIISIIHKKLANKVDPDGNMKDSIAELGSMLIRLSVSVFILSLAIKLMSKIDQNDLIKGGIAVAAVLIALTAALVAIMKQLHKPYLSNKEINALTRFIKEFVKSILKLAAVFLILGVGIFAFVSLGKEWAIASMIAAAVTIAAALGAMCAVFSSLTTSVKDSGLNAGELNTITRIINAMSIFVVAVAGSIVLMAITFENVRESARNIAIGVMVGIFVSLGILMAQFKKFAEPIVKSGPETIGKYSVVFKAINTVTKSIVAIAASIGVLAIIGGITGWHTLLTAAIGLMGVFGLMMLSLYELVHDNKISNASVNKGYTIVSEAAKTMSIAMLAIAGAIAIILVAVYATKSDIMAVGDALLYCISGFAVVVFALWGAAKFFDGKDMKKMSSMAKAFMVMAAGIAIISVAMAIMIRASKGIDQNVPALVLSMAALTAVIGLISGLAAKFLDADKAFEVGSSLAGSFVIFALAFLALAGALKVMQEAGITDDTIDQFKSIMWSMFWLLSLLGGIGYVTENIAKTVEGGLSNMLIRYGVILAEVAAFLIAISHLVDWDALGRGLKALGDAGLAGTLAIVIPLVLLLVSAVVGGEVAGGMAKFAGSLALLGLAMMAVGAGLTVLAVGIQALRNVIAGDDVVDFTAANAKLFGNSGKNNVDQYVNGIESSERNASSRVATSMGNIANAGVQATEDAFEINSPSKVAMWEMDMWGEGIVQGLENQMSDVKSTSLRLGESVVDGFIESMDAANPMKHIQTISGEMVQAYGESIQNGFESAQGTVQEGFGDFAFDYSEAFDDAPITPTVTPVIDAEELDNQVQAVRQDEALGLTPTIDLSGLESLSIDSSALDTALGEEGPLGKLTSLFEEDDKGETGLHKLLFGENGLFGTENVNEIKSTLSDALGLPPGGIEELKDEYLGENGKLAKFADKYLGEEGTLNKSISSGASNIASELLTGFTGSNSTLGAILNFISGDWITKSKSRDPYMDLLEWRDRLANMGWSVAGRDMMSMYDPLLGRTVYRYYDGTELGSEAPGWYNPETMTTYGR